MSFQNSRKKSFLQSIPVSSIENDSDNTACKMKFNFSYFDVTQEAGQDFSDWTNEQLLKLLNKLQEYSGNSISHWTRESIGKGRNHVLEIYGSFPRKSEFKQPKHVPHQALWSRFRLESSVRLIGFILPEEFNGKEQRKSGFFFCSNTFYIVFLDKDHLFYSS